jgi:hypothetical protein
VGIHTVNKRLESCLEIGFVWVCYGTSAFQGEFNNVGVAQIAIKNQTEIKKREPISGLPFSYQLFTENGPIRPLTPTFVFHQQ